MVPGLDEVMIFRGNLLREAISTFAETAIEAKILNPREMKKAEKLLRVYRPDLHRRACHTTGVESLKISIEYKLMRVDADLEFFQTRSSPLL